MRTESSHLSRLKPDKGETLVEILMTITIVSISFVLIITAIMTAVKSSTSDNRSTIVDRLVNQWAENLAAQPYLVCGNSADYTSRYPPSSASMLGTEVNGYTATYSAVTYWNGATSTWKDDSCGSPQDTTKDWGIQRVQLTIVAPDAQWPGFTRQLWVTLRKPCPANSSPAC